jgi:hypothetical protein
MTNKIYNLTNQVYNSNSTIAKIAKYSLIGIALVAIAETIKNIVESIFKIITNSNIEKTALKKDGKKIEPLQTNNQQKGNWKKIAIRAAIAVLGIAVVAGLGYYLRPVTSPSNTPDRFSNEATKKYCEKVFSENFKGYMACGRFGGIDVNIPKMKPSEFTVDELDSYLSAGRYQCIAYLTEEGRKALLPTYHIPWNRYIDDQVARNETIPKVRLSWATSSFE